MNADYTLGDVQHSPLERRNKLWTLPVHIFTLVIQQSNTFFKECVYKICIILQCTLLSTKRI